MRINYTQRVVYNSIDIHTDVSKRVIYTITDVSKRVICTDVFKRGIYKYRGLKLGHLYRFSQTRYLYSCVSSSESSADSVSLQMPATHHSDARKHRASIAIKHVFNVTRCHDSVLSRFVTAIFRLLHLQSRYRSLASGLMTLPSRFFIDILLLTGFGAPGKSLTG